MLKLLKKSLKSLVSICSSKKSSAVKPGSSLSSLSSNRRQKINKYIKNKIYIFKLDGRVLADKYSIKPKLIQVFMLGINLFLTGYAIKYCIVNNNAISYGLMVLLGMFYFERIVTIIKTPINKNVDEE